MFQFRHGVERRRSCLRLSVVAASAITLVVGIAIARAQQAPLPKPVQGSDAADRSGRKVGLKDQLRVGLNATTKADIAFIDLVVLKVNQGRLPRNMVDSTFLWARSRWKTRPTAHRLRPIVYFQPALTARAKAIGVTL